MPRPPLYPRGTTVNDRYELIVQLGTDGSVYQAHDRNLDKTVALKFLHPSGGVAQSWREAQRLEHLRSRFLVDIINADVVVSSDIRFIVTPLLHGGDLEAAAAGIGLSVDDAVRYTQQIAAGVDRIHAAGMVHRDIKPANVLLRGDEALVSDLEFCEILDSQGRADRNGSWCTLAPETALDDGHCSVASDVYSLGATAFYLLSGQYPIDHTLPRSEQKALVERGEIREVRDLAPHVSQAVGTVIRRALNADAARRFSTALRFSNSLVSAAHNTRNWRRLSHPGHVHCLEGAAFKGKAPVTICSLPADHSLQVVACYTETGRRVTGTSEQVVALTALPKCLRRLVRSLH